jgi:hypothetical protein
VEINLGVMGKELKGRKFKTNGIRRLRGESDIADLPTPRFQTSPEQYFPIVGLF